MQEKARAEANKIIEKAKSDAEKIISAAQERVAKIEESTATSLKQAGRDVILTLKKEIASMLDKLIASDLRQALQPEEMTRIIMELVKQRSGSGEIIVSLKKEDKEKVRKKVKEYLDYRKERHPKEPSAGSVFKNPPGFFARDLILKCGLAGKIIGGAKISEQHQNFILNFNNARAKDVKDLIILAKQKVKNKFNIKLEEEIQYLG